MIFSMPCTSQYFVVSAAKRLEQLIADLPYWPQYLRPRCLSLPPVAPTKNFDQMIGARWVCLETAMASCLSVR
jgi:hypothetical protein